MSLIFIRSFERELFAEIKGALILATNWLISHREPFMTRKENQYETRISPIVSITNGKSKERVVSGISERLSGQAFVSKGYVNFHVNFCNPEAPC